LNPRPSGYERANRQSRQVPPIDDNQHLNTTDAFNGPSTFEGFMEPEGLQRVTSSLCDKRVAIGLRIVMTLRSER
jgi:hypothetical protein